jgi:hypothetical protein
VTHWQTAILFAGACAVFAGGLYETSARRAADARIERTAAIRFCEDDNAGRALLRDFVLAAVRDPDPRQYEFIEDPTLRAGALDQARRSRAEMRGRAEATFTARDCAAQFPAPPNGGS